ncbi:RDD family protein [Longimicrobium sp.]|uniref:RDD family protein n=1 Tax=Longimicrobium sp. TaxID=2029185 RepID=UPI003B3B5DAB
MRDPGLTVAAAAPDDVWYGRFPRRIQAVVVDGAILASLLLLGPALAGVLPAAASRTVNRAVLLCVVLYEPVMVSVWGGTVGHTLLNLKVVSASTGGRLPFHRALVRFVTKTVFGLISFLFIALTARHQALHDMAAAAVVQVRDRSRANPADFATERVADAGPAAPASGWRRAGIAAVYMVGTFLLVSVMAALLVSPECLDAGLCSGAENNALDVAFAVWALLWGTIAVLAWRGRLPGARHHAGDGDQAQAPESWEAQGDGAGDPR